MASHMGHQWNLVLHPILMHKYGDVTITVINKPFLFINIYLYLHIYIHTYEYLFILHHVYRDVNIIVIDKQYLFINTEMLYL